MVPDFAWKIKRACSLALFARIKTENQKFRTGFFDIGKSF